MRIQLLFFEGCPHVTETRNRIQAVLDRVAPQAQLEEVLVSDDEQAAELKFVGSPSVRVDDVDIQGQMAPPGGALCCRLYGPSGAPPEQMIEAAILQALRETHWDRVYATNQETEVSWYAPTLATSLELIGRAGLDGSTRVVDIGGGVSTLVDDLLDGETTQIAVVEVSRIALDKAKTRLGDRADRVDWIAGDVTTVELPAQHFHIWHDRAVFHFLTGADDRRAYVSQLCHALRPSGHLVMGCFADDGPRRCSGLDVVRYSDRSLHDELGSGWRLVQSRRETHKTPSGNDQRFIYCLFRREEAGLADLQSK